MQSVGEFLRSKNSVSAAFDRKRCGDLGSEGKAFPSKAYVKVQQRPSRAPQEYVQFFLPACTKVTAEVMTMSSTEQPRDRSLIGEAKPCKIGPNASAPAKRCTNL